MSFARWCRRWLRRSKTTTSTATGSPFADLTYRAGSTHAKQQLDLYLPTHTREPFRFVVFVHGGIWKAQDRRFFQPPTGLYGAVGLSLAHQGSAPRSWAAGSIRRPVSVRASMMLRRPWRSRSSMRGVGGPTPMP